MRLRIVAGVPDRDVVAFVLGNLPSPPARVLEVGAGDGVLARLLTGSGYDVVAIDPDARTSEVLRVALADLDAPAASFDAAVAVVSLHHVDPLDASCERLAQVLRPGAMLVVDELDVDRFDERAAGWWLEQRRALGFEDAASARDMVAEAARGAASAPRIEAALDPHFELRPPQRSSYLHRWGLDEALRPLEEELIAAGALPAVGARLVGRRARRAGVDGRRASG